MTTRKPLAALTLAGLLALTACSENHDAPPPSAAPSSTTGPTIARIGEEQTDHCAPAMPCEIKFTIEDITVTDKCPRGTGEFSKPLDPRTQKVLTLKGQATAVQTIHKGHFHTFENPTVIDSDGFSSNDANFFICNDEPGNQWSDPLHEGNKSKMSGTWVIPKNAAQIQFGGATFDLPSIREIDEATASTDSLPAPSSATVSSGSEDVTPTFVMCSPGTPGVARYSDGSNRPDSSCGQTQPQPPAPDLSKIPYADGGTCPAAICGYGHDANGNKNPSSGELQFQHGCEQGYISREQCASRGY